MNLPAHTTIQDGLVRGPGYYPDPPYLDTTCCLCGAPLRHTGSNGGIVWVIPDSMSAFRDYECPNNVQKGRIAQHVPLTIVSEKEVSDVCASIAETIRDAESRMRHPSRVTGDA